MTVDVVAAGRATPDNLVFARAFIEFGKADGAVSFNGLAVPVQRTTFFRKYARDWRGSGKDVAQFLSGQTRLTAIDEVGFEHTIKHID